MDLLCAYAASDKESEASDDQAAVTAPISVQLAAPVPLSSDDAVSRAASQLVAASTAKPTTKWNPAGDAHLFTINDASFRRQERAFGRIAQCKDPETQQIIRNHSSVYTLHPEDPAHAKRALALKEKEAKYAPTASKPNKNSKKSEDGGIVQPPTPKRARRSGRDDEGIMVPTSQFHAHDVLDEGRSWVDAAAGMKRYEDLENYSSYVPKKCIYEFPRAHKNGGASCVQFIHDYGHLLLSGGLDGSAKVWSVKDDARKRCMRTYTGHKKGVKDVSFSYDQGRSFLTASYDRTIKLWDTETGKVISHLDTHRSIPHCVEFNPTVEHRNELLVGCSDKKVLQLDVRNANEVVQTYDQHMGAVNSITFVDDNRRFVSSCDDKVVRVWEYGIPVVIKFISDAKMHSMPRVVQHPSKKYLAAQSMDNSIKVFSSKQQRFKLKAKKRFVGHAVAGYACGMGFSPDGRFLASGDSNGKTHIWEWSSTKLISSLPGHKGVCIDAKWHPTKTSMLATCGWDGKINLWD